MDLPSRTIFWLLWHSRPVSSEDSIHSHGWWSGPIVLNVTKVGGTSLWSSFTMGIEAAYGPSVFDCPRYSLFKLQQHDTVSHYYFSFTTLTNRVDGLSLGTLLNCFITCIKRVIQRYVIWCTHKHCRRPSCWQSFWRKILLLLERIYEIFYPPRCQLIKQANTYNRASHKALLSPLPSLTTPILIRPPPRPPITNTAQPKKNLIQWNATHRDKGFMFYLQGEVYLATKTSQQKIIVYHGMMTS